MPTSTDQITVTRAEQAGRYEIHVGDVLAGFTEFSPGTQGRVRFPHTVMDPAFQGRGLAQELIAGALADAARRGDIVIPLCPVVAKYLRENEVPGLRVQWPAGAR